MYVAVNGALHVAKIFVKKILSLKVEERLSFVIKICNFKTNTSYFENFRVGINLKPGDKYVH